MQGQRQIFPNSWACKIVMRHQAPLQGHIHLLNRLIHLVRVKVSFLDIFSNSTRKGLREKIMTMMICQIWQRLEIFLKHLIIKVLPRNFKIHKINICLTKHQLILNNRVKRISSYPRKRKNWNSLIMLMSSLRFFLQRGEPDKKSPLFNYSKISPQRMEELYQPS
jgi:hypothetical protein